MLVRQALYHMSHAPRLFMFNFLVLRQDRTNFAQVGLRVTILLLFSPEYLRLQVSTTRAQLSLVLLSGISSNVQGHTIQQMMI
jgi:hypothetical protein